jgi:hypothetical protein
MVKRDLTAKIIKTGRRCMYGRNKASWFAIKDIGLSPFVGLRAYMEEIGLSPLWDELSIEEG